MKPKNISHTLTLSTPHNILNICYTYQNAPFEVEVVLDNSKGLGLSLWLCMLNASRRDVYTTSAKVEKNLREGRISEAVLEKFLTISLERGKINHTPQPTPAPQPSFNSPEAKGEVLYEEELVDTLSYEDMCWYYYAEMPYILGYEAGNSSLTDLENSQL